ncbi:MAG: SMI1/KNR4 family protein [Gammaproteobacteria bacterium]|nr:SMI1/KNR4 family protein [Gammaproteobacteria bacterium]
MDLREALELGKNKLAPVSPAFITWAESHGIPKCILKHFLTCWVQSTGSGVGCHSLLSEAEILAGSNESTRYLTHCLLLIGSGPNGDPIVMDTSDKPGQVGFTSHDALWGDDNVNPRYHLAYVAPNLEEFIIRSWDDNFPADYDEAQDWKPQWRTPNE